MTETKKTPGKRYHRGITRVKLFAKFHDGGIAGGVVGMKNRNTGKVAAKVVASTDAVTLEGFVTVHAADEAMIYTDGVRACRGLPRHESVSHSTGEHVNRMAHTNAVESFWTGFKRGFQGTHHHLSGKHLGCYVAAGRFNDHPLDTLDQMAAVARGLVGERLRYRELVG